MSRSARAVLFDLDDTLYPQRRFVISGFAAVARHLQCLYGLDPRRVFLVLRAAWREARGRELQACVAHFDLPVAMVPALVEVIRGHQPTVRLPRRSTRTLLELRDTCRTGIVTNGSPAIQARKVEALDLRALVDTIVFAGEHGTGRGKPEAAGFSAALARLGVPPDRAVFVGNDEACDIAGAAAVGMRTLLLVRSSRLMPGATCPGPQATTRADAMVDTIADVPRVVASLMGCS